MNDPSPTTALPTYDDAIARVLSKVERLGVERLPLTAALGRVLREDIVADRDQPPFDRSAMDGFAVRSSTVRGGVRYPIVGEIRPGEGLVLLNGGELPGPRDGVVRIATGAALAGPFDAVVPIERATVDGDAVSFDVEAVQPGTNVHHRGVDARRHSVVLPAGTKLAAHHLGIAAAVGAVEVAVTRRPAVCVLTTGDEVRPPATPGSELSPQQIRNSNGPMLTALLAAWGGELIHHVHIPDDPDITLTAAREALAQANLVITAGGVSAGVRDYLPWAWKHLGLATVLHGVAIQPGKPVFAAQNPHEHEKLVLGLPGNPVSVWVTAHLFVWAVLRRQCGMWDVVSGMSEDAAMPLHTSSDIPHPTYPIPHPPLPWRRVWLAEQVKANAKRQMFRPCRFVGETREQVAVIPWHGSGDLVHTAGADGIVRLPMQDEPVTPGTPLAMLEVE